MNGTAIQISLFLVIILCSAVVSQGQGAIKLAAFGVGILAAGMSIYHYWKKK